MSEQRLDQLDRAVERLRLAQQEALETCEGVLDSGYEVTVDAGAFDDAPRAPGGEGQLYRAALRDVRTILVSASEDVQAILGEDSGSS